MENLEVKQVPFMGTELMAARDADGQVWAGVRWMCDGIGLTEGQARRERKRIQCDRVLSGGGSNLTLPTNSGIQDVLCLKLDYVPLWLAKINITPKMEEETPEAASRLLEYQLKVKDVLAGAFLANGPSHTMTANEILVSSIELLAQQAKSMVEMEKRINETNGRVLALESKLDAALRPAPMSGGGSWRDSMDATIREFCKSERLSPIKFRAKLYAELEEKTGCDVQRRLSLMRNRAKKAGRRYADAARLTKLDAIAEDTKLRETFDGIIMEWCVSSNQLQMDMAER